MEISFERQGTDDSHGAFTDPRLVDGPDINHCLAHQEKYETGGEQGGKRDRKSDLGIRFGEHAPFVVLGDQRGQIAIALDKLKHRQQSENAGKLDDRTKQLQRQQMADDPPRQLHAPRFIEQSHTVPLSVSLVV